MNRPPNKAPDPGQLAFDLGHEPSLTEENFIVTAGNELAFQHIMAFPEWPGPLSLIVGPPKSGKTHLALIWARRAGARVVVPDSLERLAGEGGDGPLVVEDADSGLYPETALFHLLNQAMRADRPVLMTAGDLPSAWPLKTDDVRSRVRLAALFSVEADDDIQLSQMLVKLFADRQIAIEPRVVAYLVRRMERSPEEAVALVDLADKLALSRGSAITRTIAAEAVALRAARRGAAAEKGATKGFAENE